jgi:murein DD-endopeptidase MepM/ murein hydrolase activator NlpD
MKRQFAAVLFCTSILFGWTTVQAHAEVKAVKSEVDALNNEIKEKQDRVKELDGLISSYKTRITDQESKQTTLENEVLLLENRIVKKELDIERAKTEAESLQLEISSLEAQIEDQDIRIGHQREYAEELLRTMQRSDDVLPLEVLMSEPSLSGFFNQMEEVRKLQDDLTDSLEKVKGLKKSLEDIRVERDAKRVALGEEQKQLTQEELALEAERNFKASLASETQSKQEEFERVLYELREQQQSTSDDISSIETKLKGKLDAIDESLARGDVLLNWPLDPAKGITAIFHDPTYPFRNLFEHPGTDVRAKVGTAVKAAGGGYVAWNKTGRMYGNYTMIVHPGNIATVYAHLSKFIAKPDTYVERGDTIAESGGMPGMPGAGLSTGPHLHFEVRSDGIPVDAENYLPSIPNDYYDYYADYKKLKVRP